MIVNTTFMEPSYFINQQSALLAVRSQPELMQPMGTINLFGKRTPESFRGTFLDA